ncbi:MAG: ABC transporter permease subunit [Verrucomicrobiales bacterium]|nr:ABC transporter permease subunit [Verrucomicrobiales bacterium]
MKELFLHFFVPAAILTLIFVALLLFVLPREIRTIFKRELKAYFVSPVAYVMIVVFLGLSNGLAFFLWHVLEWGEADLFRSYFFWLPLYMTLVVPALGMRLWSEEQRLGTMELVLTMPLSPWHAILGKFLAAAVVIFAMLVLSFPIVWTINYLGDPDNGVMFAGYLATFLVGLVYLAVTSVMSALTRSQMVALLISFAVCLILWLGGLPPVNDFVTSLRGIGLALWPFLKGIQLVEILSPFEQFAKGDLHVSHLVFFISFVGFCLVATSVALRMKRA